MATEVVNVRTHKGPWIYVGRSMPGKGGHPLGNPFKLPENATQLQRNACLADYRDWLSVHPKRESLLRELADAVLQTGLPLGCWCHPATCHAHVLAEEVDKILASQAVAL